MKTFLDAVMTCATVAFVLAFFYGVVYSLIWFIEYLEKKEW